MDFVNAKYFEIHQALCEPNANKLSHYVGYRNQIAVLLVPHTSSYTIQVSQADMASFAEPEKYEVLETIGTFTTEARNSLLPTCLS